MRSGIRVERLWTPILCLVALLVLLASASPARALFLPIGSIPLPGISLGDLAHGDQFQSGDGSLAFSGFEVEVSGIALHNLDFYRVIPSQDGFKLLAPMAAAFGSSGELSLRYQVSASEGLEIEAMSIWFQGFAIGCGAEVGAMLALLDSSEVELGELSVFNQGFRHGRKNDAIHLTPPLGELTILEEVLVNSGDHFLLGGFAAGAVISHHFDVVPVPEPTTALLAGCGLIVLAIARRR
jgi:hypothetical protein